MNYFKSFLILAIVPILLSCQKDDPEPADFRLLSVGTYDFNAYVVYGQMQGTKGKFTVSIDQSDKNGLILTFPDGTELHFTNAQKCNDTDFTFDLIKTVVHNADGDALNRQGIDEYSCGNRESHGGFRFLGGEFTFYLNYEFQNPQYSDNDVLYEYIGEKQVK